MFPYPEEPHAPAPATQDTVVAILTAGYHQDLGLGSPTGGDGDLLCLLLFWVEQHDRILHTLTAEKEFSANSSQPLPENPSMYLFI